MDPSQFRVRTNASASVTGSPASVESPLLPYFSDDAALRLHLFLGPGPVSGNRQSISSFQAALRDVREATGRDLSTGMVQEDQEPKSGNWLGAIGYMALLDQIGTSLKPKARSRATGSGIVRALKHWSSLDSTVIDALYALRCALAHDYSLFNRNPRHPSLQHLFALDRSATGPVVRLPKKPWDGKYERLDPTTQTYVSIRLLGDLTEEVVARVRQSAKSGDVEILLSGGGNELAFRYGLIVPAAS